MLFIKMSKLILRALAPEDEAAFYEGMKEWEGEKPEWYTFAWKPGMAFAEMLAVLARETAGIDLAPDRVPHSMLYGFVDGKIIGRVSIRHRLNAHLERRGGNLGYAVAPRFRRQGYAVEMTRQAIGYCRGLGLGRVLVTCADHNVASWKVIESFGGKLESQVFDDEAKEMIRRYWIGI